MSEASSKLEVVVVTGRSGAGKTTAVNALEDLGYYCVDNLPPPVILPTLEALAHGGEQRIALGVDVRVRAYLEGAAAVLDLVADRPDMALSILYLDSSDELLARRFNATRRPHPLTAAGHADALVDGIHLERELLAPLRARADAVIDTSDLSVHELRREVVGHFSKEKGQRRPLMVRIVSFGFKYGAPHDADMLFDVRFLPNPHFVEELSPLTGLDAPVAKYVLAQPDAQELLTRVVDFLSFCLPRFLAEGKSYVTIGIGCTGGRHRSVALTESIAEQLSRGGALRVEPSHRDVARASVRPQAPNHVADDSEKTAGT